MNTKWPTVVLSPLRPIHSVVWLSVRPSLHPVHLLITGVKHKTFFIASGLLTMNAWASVGTGVGTKLKRRNVYTGLRPWLGPGPIVSYCTGSVLCVRPSSIPVQCEYGIIQVFKARCLEIYQFRVSVGIAVVLFCNRQLYSSSSFKQINTQFHALPPDDPYWHTLFHSLNVTKNGP